MARKDNTCIDCSRLRNPKAKIGRCQDCKTKFDRQESVKRYTEQLIHLGYTIKSEVSSDRLSKITVVNNSCGHEFTAQLGNILNQCTKCSICGPKNRIQKALNGYMRLYGKDYNLLEKDDYTKLVRAKSIKALKKVHGKDFIVPNGYHIDHIIPISFGFKNKLSVDVMSDISNLRIIPAFDNISKGNKIQNFDKLNEIAGTSHNVDVSHNWVKTFVSELISNLPGSTVVKANGMQIDIDDSITILINSQSDGIKKGNEILVFEDEIEDGRMRKKILSLVKGRMGINERIFARKLKVVEIKNVDSSRFLDANHRQKSARAKVHLGLIDENEELKAVMTLGKPRFNNNFEWEIIRYASQLHTNVVGGASKLFSYFKNNYNPQSVISYADLRWGSGKVYESLGFKYSHKTSSNYWYEKNGNRIARAKCQKHLLPSFLGEFYDEELTETQNMLKFGYRKVKDFGNNAFILNLHE